MDGAEGWVREEGELVFIGDRVPLWEIECSGRLVAMMTA